MEALRNLIEAWIAADPERNQTKFARLSGVPQNVVGQWLNGHVDEASARNLKRIAPVLGLSYEDLLRRLGELPQSDSETDPIKEAILQRVPEMLEAVEGAPRAFWGSIIKSTWDRAIADARDMAQLVSAAAKAPVSASAEGGVSAISPELTLDDSASSSQLPLRKPLVAAASPAY